MTTRCAKLFAAALHVDTTPQSTTAEAKYMEGRTRVIIIFEGSCISRYPTKKMEVAKLKSVPCMPKSFSKEPWRACARLDRSRKLSKYMTIKNGNKCKSILRTSFLSSNAIHSGSLLANLRKNSRCASFAPGILSSMSLPWSEPCSIWSTSVSFNTVIVCELMRFEPSRQLPSERLSRKETEGVL